MRWIILVLPVLLSGCLAPMLPPESTSYLRVEREASEDSLFSSDAEVLSDEAIERILEFQWQPPSNARIAILPFGAEYWFGWSEELTDAAISVQNRLTDRLADSATIERASLLPSILVPKERTVARLREAAARYQADLMLVYRARCQSFDKHRILQNNSSRARCTVDALLLDTRTGLVPFSLAESESFDAKKSEQDLTFQETILRAQVQATASALNRVASQVVSFIDSQQDRHARLTE